MDLFFIIQAKQYKSSSSYRFLTQLFTQKVTNPVHACCIHMISNLHYLRVECCHLVFPVNITVFFNILSYYNHTENCYAIFIQFAKSTFSDTSECNLKLGHTVVKPTINILMF